MAIENPRWNKDGTMILATIDGQEGGFPAVRGNRHFDELWSAGRIGAVTPYKTPMEEEKPVSERINDMLAREGLTLDDLKAALAEK